ncbi:Ger(x)C family spore germination protein [Paenibacillus beijingensis]|uniref:Uncharacterized protein n=1 Tax=Paenibacillus beijingensis TaxID=1126833 RepID=A0A0D5NNJ6_9BACL|nr:Ger(x)C family spore germination protein [Paenibacillus beijingensis]AJY76493.1 hypothetical protein VN24_20375 [Paenibacillus beijingensis]
MLTALRIIAAAALCLLIGGCWDKTELNELGIISGTAVDLTSNGKWDVSYQLVIPQAISAQTGGGGGQSAPFNVFSTEADSLRGAISKATQEMSRKLYFAHNQVIIISEQAARKGIGTLMDVYLRNSDSRETVDVFVVPDNARLMLEQILPLDRISGAGLERLVDIEENNGGSFREMTMHQVLLKLLGPTRSVAIPGLALTGANKKLDNIEILGHTATPSKVRLQRLAVIREDSFVGWLNTQESMGAMWLSGYLKRATLSFSNGAGAAKRNSVQIRAASTTVKPERTGDGWTMHVQVQAAGRLIEYNGTENLQRPASVPVLEQQIGTLIKTNMEMSWMAVRRLKADFLGFGELVRERYPAQWKKIAPKWNELEFPAVKLDIKVKFKLKDTGLSNNSFRSVQEKSDR